MDSIDHENIPSPNLEKMYSNFVHRGFDYVNPSTLPRQAMGTVESVVTGASFCSQANKSLSAPLITTFGHFDVGKSVSQSTALAPSIEACKPFGWIYKSIFSDDQEVNKKLTTVKYKHNIEKSDGNTKNNSLPSKRAGPRKYVLSNFDINALSPNSW